MTEHQRKQFHSKASKPVSGQHLCGLAPGIQVYPALFLAFPSTHFLLAPVLPRCSSSMRKKPTGSLKEFIFQAYLTWLMPALVVPSCPWLLVRCIPHSASRF